MQAVRQLASILRQAEDLFQDLGTECVKIHARTERINKRIGSLGVTVAAYNPRKQKIREYNPRYNAQLGNIILGISPGYPQSVIV